MNKWQFHSFSKKTWHLWNSESIRKIPLASLIQVGDVVKNVHIHSYFLEGPYFLAPALSANWEKHTWNKKIFTTFHLGTVLSFWHETFKNASRPPFLVTAGVGDENGVRGELPDKLLTRRNRHLILKMVVQGEGPGKGEAIRKEYKF